MYLKEDEKVSFLKLTHAVTYLNGEFYDNEIRIFDIDKKYLENITSWTELMLSSIEQGNSSVQL